MAYCNKKEKGFTLIELLVVIAIISLLSAIVISVVQAARAKAKVTRSKADLRILQNVMQVATGERGVTLGFVTGNNSGGTDNWTGETCVSYTAGPIRQLKGSTGTCYTDWVNAINQIASAASTSYRIEPSTYYRDQWGSPYYLDENENTTFGCSVFDSLMSAGPDGYVNDPIHPSFPATIDDIRVEVTPSYTGC